MSQILTETPPLIHYLEPKTLRQLGVLGEVLHFHCHYSPTTLPKTGKQKWLSKLPLGISDTVTVNINVACACYDRAGDLLECVSFRQVRAFDDAVRYAGDSLQTSKEPILHSHHEEISLRLGNLPKKVASIALLVHAYRHQPLQSVPIGEIILQTSEHTPIHQLTFSSLQKDTTALLAWMLTSVGDDWQLSAPMREFSGALSAGVDIHAFAKKLSHINHNH